MAVNEEKSVLSVRQQRALSALMGQASIAQAAVAAKVGQRTLYRWLREDDTFRSEFQKLKQEITADGLLQLQKAVTGAVSCLVEVMTDVIDSPPSARVAAAREILQQALPLMEAEMLEQRILELEQKVEEFSQSRAKSLSNGKGIWR
jgi:hypothetical protein